MSCEFLLFSSFYYASIYTVLYVQNGIVLHLVRTTVTYQWPLVILFHILYFILVCKHK